jgi:hypothetical protein
MLRRAPVPDCAAMAARVERRVRAIALAACLCAVAILGARCASAHAATASPLSVTVFTDQVQI